MSRLLVAYATNEGHTAKIAGEIAHTLREHGHRVYLRELTAHTQPPPLMSFDGILLGSPVHTGKHASPLTRLVRDNLDWLHNVPSAFFSVSLAAASEFPKSRAEAERLLHEFLEQTQWRPNLTASIAGALRYSRYGPIKRWIMRRVAAKEGGGTDTSRDYEYTDWEQVRRFGDDFSALVSARSSSTAA